MGAAAIDAASKKLRDQPPKGILRACRDQDSPSATNCAYCARVRGKCLNLPATTVAAAVAAQAAAVAVIKRAGGEHDASVHVPAPVGWDGLIFVAKNELSKARRALKSSSSAASPAVAASVVPSPVEPAAVAASFVPSPLQPAAAESTPASATVSVKFDLADEVEEIKGTLSELLDEMVAIRRHLEKSAKQKETLMAGLKGFCEGILRDLED
ncbi:Fc.00g001830.m01.CDS01 [Cosmosporella sp. VM-42]